MTPARILETLAAAGVTVTRHGDRLRLKPASGNVPGDVVELARASKTELLQALPDGAEIARQRARLLAATRELGIPPVAIAALPDCDAADCEHLTDAGIARYVQILLENHLRARGVAILHPVAQPATRQPPRPAVTCAACTHQQPQPDTSDAGMRACAKGRPLHYALELHVCAEWHPLKVQP